jgi:hypothetical protein
LRYPAVINPFDFSRPAGFSVPSSEDAPKNRLRYGVQPMS